MVFNKCFICGGYIPQGQFRRHVEHSDVPVFGCEVYPMLAKHPSVYPLCGKCFYKLYFRGSGRGLFPLYDRDIHGGDPSFFKNSPNPSLNPRHGRVEIRGVKYYYTVMEYPLSTADSFSDAVRLQLFPASHYMRCRGCGRIAPKLTQIGWDLYYTYLCEKCITQVIDELPHNEEVLYV